MKEYLSQVPNLYVEDGAICSGRCAEMRIRSVTNDPVTAHGAEEHAGNRCHLA